MKPPVFHTPEQKAILNEAAEKLTDYFIGGFIIDEAILGLYATLVAETDDGLGDDGGIPSEQIWPRIQAALDAAFSVPKGFENENR